jgi:Flp pilus assembly protein TadG
MPGAIEVARELSLSPGADQHGNPIMLRSSATQAMTRVTPAGSRPASRLCRRFLELLGKCRASEDGVSAVEFGLMAPFLLFFPLLSMVDVGMAISERMAVDSVLRAGAHEAMKDSGKDKEDKEDKVLEALYAISAKNFPLANGVAPDGLNAPKFTVKYLCDCPEQQNVACSATCSGNVATSIFYDLTGKKTFTGNFLPAIELAPEIRVQVR